MTYVLVSLAAMLIGVVIGAKMEATAWQLSRRKLIVELKQEKACAVLKAFQRGLLSGRKGKASQFSLELQKQADGRVDRAN